MAWKGQAILKEVGPKAIRKLQIKWLEIGLAI